MSDKLHTLKEINLDAARYRWLREKYITANVYDEEDKCTETWIMGNAEDLDDAIDAELALDN